MIHKTGDNWKKVESAHDFIKNLNPFVEVITFPEYISPSNSRNIVKQFDFVIDGSDNAECRYIVNDACVLENKTLISGASV